MTLSSRYKTGGAPRGSAAADGGELCGHGFCFFASASRASSAASLNRASDSTCSTLSPAAAATRR